jgi:hypothetical protein
MFYRMRHHLAGFMAHVLLHAPLPCRLHGPCLTACAITLQASWPMFNRMRHHLAGFMAHV